MTIPPALRPGLPAFVTAVAAAALPASGWSFDSGSTGADGAFNALVSTEVALPPSGVLNFTIVNIPAGVTVTFRRNAANTPVVILATGNVTIAGTIDVSGRAAAASGAAGGGALGDDGLPGVGGPGGFDGGRGGRPAAFGAGAWLGNRGAAGLGPGGGRGGVSAAGGACGLNTAPGGAVVGGAGGGYGLAGAAPLGTAAGIQTCLGLASSPAYGSNLVLPLIGGSGGGGGGGGANFAGAGGGGSGGAIRVIATTLAGNGVVSAAGGAAGSQATSSGHIYHGTEPGAVGRVRLEAETITRTEPSIPIASIGTPGSPFVAGLPALRIVSVGGVPAPAAPTGQADITLPAATPNPVNVAFETTGVPVGNTVRLTVTPSEGGVPLVAISPALTGSTASATASVAVDLPPGPSVLLAQTSYTVVAALGEALRQFAGGEPVARVQLTAAAGGASQVTLITASGREVAASPAALALLGH